jgi:4-amino-4-deoxy-L-arabinose transferase-like glycosyltransferase
VTQAKAIEAAAPATSRRPRAPDYGTALLFFLGALLGLRLLAVILARTDLFFDEAQYWAWSREIAFGYFSKPPLIGWIIRAATDVCGNSEACVRAPAPILYAVTSYFVFLAGRALYDDRIGFWSAIVFATLPGVSFSSGLISTDVPLLACWTIALYGWIKLVETHRLGYAILVGLSLGLGLLAKYAAIYFLLCAGIDAWRDKEARAALGGDRGLVALILALAILAPNLVWNAENGFATFSQRAERLMAAQGAKAILTDSRELTAELLYYLRDTHIPIAVWPRGPIPRDHFEMTRPYTSSTPEPLLYVSLRKPPRPIVQQFGTVTMVEEDSFPSMAPARMAHFYVLTEPGVAR